MILSSSFLIDSRDYYASRFFVYRHFNNALGLKLKISALWNNILLLDDENIKKNRKIIIVKKIIGFFPLGLCCNLKKIRRFVESCKVGIIKKQDTSKGYSFTNWPLFETATVINSNTPEFIKQLSAVNGVKLVISIIENDLTSNLCYIKNKSANVQDASYRLINLVHYSGLSPEKRFASDIVIMPNMNIGLGKFDAHNALVQINTYMHYSTTGRGVVCLTGENTEIWNVLGDHYNLTSIQSEGNVILISKK